MLNKKAMECVNEKKDKTGFNVLKILYNCSVENGQEVSHYKLFSRHVSFEKFKTNCMINFHLK